MFLLNKRVSVFQITPIAVGFFQIFFQIVVATIGSNENNFERFSAKFFVKVLKLQTNFKFRTQEKIYIGRLRKKFR